MRRPVDIRESERFHRERVEARLIDIGYSLLGDNQERYRGKERSYEDDRALHKASGKLRKLLKRRFRKYPWTRDGVVGIMLEKFIPNEKPAAEESRKTPKEECDSRPLEYARELFEELLRGLPYRPRFLGIPLRERDWRLAEIMGWARGQNINVYSVAKGYDK